jgi:hypothetical protein
MQIDDERAQAFVLTWARDGFLASDVPLDRAGLAVADLLAAVRVDERRAIVAWLRDDPSPTALQAPVVLETLARRIEARP